MSQILVKHRVDIDFNTGKVNFKDLELFNKQKDSLRGKKAIIYILEDEPNSSPDQIKYYFGVLLRIAHKSNDYNHFDKSDDLHYKHFGNKYLGYSEVEEKEGKKRLVRKIKSIAELPMSEMSEFIERVIVDLAMDGIDVLSPQEYALKQNKIKQL